LSAMNAGMMEFVETGDIMKALASRIESGATYDLIWLTNVLEHARNPVELLRALRGLRADGGVCLVTVPNDATELQEYLLTTGTIKRRFWIALPDHLAYFDQSSLRSIASACGWTTARLLAEFPVDWFLANPYSNYVENPSAGRAAHEARIALDTLIARSPMDDVLAFYESMARTGMGRQLVGVLV